MKQLVPEPTHHVHAYAGDESDVITQRDNNKNPIITILMWCLVEDKWIFIIPPSYLAGKYMYDFIILIVYIQKKIYT